MGRAMATGMDEGDAGPEVRWCCACGAAFTYTLGEQLYFQQHGLQPPKRCQPCRDKRRAERASRDPARVTRG
jgi:hypothetical protein